MGNDTLRRARIPLVIANTLAAAYFAAVTTGVIFVIDLTYPRTGALAVIPALPTALTAALFLAAAISFLRLSRLRIAIQALALTMFGVALVLGGSSSWFQPLLGRVSETESLRASGPQEGIQFTNDLRFSGELSGGFEHPRFFYTIQECGPASQGIGQAGFNVHSVLGLVGEEKVLITMGVFPYGGDGTYAIEDVSYAPPRTAGPSGPAATARAARNTYVWVSRILGQIFDNQAEGWRATDGTIVVRANGLSGQLDVTLHPSGLARSDPSRTVRLQGGWTCSASRHIVR